MKNITIDEFRALKNGNISTDKFRALNTEMNEQRKRRAEETLNNLMNPISNIAQSTISGMQNRPTMSDILNDFNSKRKVFEEEQKKQATNTLNNIANKGANLLDLVGNTTNNIINDVRNSGAEDLSSYVQRKNQEQAVTNLKTNPISPLFDYGTFANEKIKQENRQNARYKSLSEAINGTQTQYGNINIKRNGINWNKDNIEQYKDRLDDLGIDTNNLEGSMSNVLGSSRTYNTKSGDMEVAYSPLLETSKGLTPLYQDEIDDYITNVLDKAEKEYKKGKYKTLKDAVIDLDKNGIGAKDANGNEIKGLIADIGDTARKTGSEMHNNYVRLQDLEQQKIQQALNLQNNLRTEATPGQKVGYTAGDVINNFAHSVTQEGTNLLQGFLYWQGDMANAFNDKEKADLLYKLAGTKDAASQYVYEPAQQELEKYSKLDDTARQVVQGLGQVATKAALSSGGNILAGGLGLTEAGTRLFNDIASNTGMFTGSMAGARNEAISQGATQDQARIYGYLSGLSETASESMFGGFGKLTDAMGISRGIGGLDEKLSYGLRKNINNAFARNLVNLGVSGIGEGTEEVVSGLASALWKKLTYLPDEDLMKLIEDENLAEQFTIGALTSLIFQIPEYTSSSLNNVDMSTKQDVKEAVQNEQINQEYKKMMDNWKKENPEAYRMLKTSEEYFDKNPVLKEGSLIESAEKYGYNPNTVEIQATQRMLDKAGIKVEFSDEINDPNIEGLWTVDNNGNRSIIINPYASKETIFQKVAVHELTHDILNKDIKEAESFKKDILDLISKEKSFTEAKTKIENLYKNITENGKPIYDLTTEEGKKKFNDIVEEELITNAMAEKFGVQEEINKLVSYKPSLARRIYDKVVEFFGKATGNEKLLWKNVQNKFERAFSQEGQFKPNEDRYSTISDLETYENNKQKAYKKIADEFGDSSNYWEANMYALDRESAIRFLKNRESVQNKFIENNNFEKVYKPVEYDRIGTEKLQDFIKDKNITSLKDLVNNEELTKQFFDLWLGNENTLDKETYKTWKDIFDSQKELFSRGRTEPIWAMKGFARDIEKINSGVTEEVDNYETAKKLKDMSEFDRYVEQFVNPLYNEKPQLSTEELTELAQDTFGTTDDFSVGAYMTPDGKLLNFRDNGTEFRNDHRDISSIGYDMQEFIDAGNIRMKPEGNGFELAQEPTAEQYDTLKDYIDSLNGEVYIEVDLGKNKYDGANYKAGTSTSKIISDLQYYFKNGKFPSKSALADFRYSINRDNSLFNLEGEGTRTKLEKLRTLDFEDKKLTRQERKIMESWRDTNYLEREKKLTDLINNSNLPEERKTELIYNELTSNEDLDGIITEDILNKLENKITTIVNDFEKEYKEKQEETSRRIKEKQQEAKSWTIAKKEADTYDSRTYNLLERLEEKYPTNRNGKRTGKEWYDFANELGQELKKMGKTEQELDKIAKQTWYLYNPGQNRASSNKSAGYENNPVRVFNNSWVKAVKNGYESVNTILPTQAKTENKTIPVKATLQDYLTHDPNYFNGDQFDFNAHRTEVINKANQDIIDIIKNSNNLREDLQKAYDLNEKSDIGNFLKTGQDEDNRLTYQHKEEILSDLLYSKDIENTDLYKLLMKEVTPTQAKIENKTIPIKEQQITSQKEKIEPREPIKTIENKEEIKSIKDITEPKVDIKDGEEAKILSEPLKRENKNRRFWAILKANIVDKGAVFEKISRLTKNRELQGKWDSTLTSGAKAQIAEANARYILDPKTNKETQVSKSLESIRDEVGDNRTAFQEYMYHQLNIDRMTLADRFEGMENKPVFGESVTADTSRDKVKQLETKYPEFKKYAQDIYDYLNENKRILVNSGVISQELSDKLDKMYPHYVPIQRIDNFKDAIAVPLDTRRTGVNAPLKSAKGGSQDIQPLFTTIQDRTLQTYKASDRNDFGLELMKSLKQLNQLNTTNEDINVDNIIEEITTENGNNELLKKGEKGKNPTFTVFENGKRVTFEINDDIYDALKPKNELLQRIDESKPAKTLRAISNFRRNLITEYNPLFMATNSIKDIQEVLFNSQHALKTYSKVPEAYAQIIKKGTWFKEYMQNGGVQNSYFTEGEFDQPKKSNSIAKKIITAPVNAISNLNEAIELAPRLAEYIASREEGRSIKTSMLDAARVTTNFKAGGDITKSLNRNGATFLNASVQGAAQVVRNFQEANAKGLKGYAVLVTKLTVAGLLPQLINGLIWNDDEDYQNLQDYIKDNYYIVGKVGDTFIRIPKGRAMATVQKIFNNAGEFTTSVGNLDGDKLASAFWKDLQEDVQIAVDNLAPNNPLENNILSPITQVISGKKWHGGDMIPTRLKDKPAVEQYDETTDSLSKFIGEKTGISPIKINYLIDQYSGGLGDVFLPMLTPQAENNPIEDKFTSNAIMKNKYPGEYYDTKEQLTIKSNSEKATDLDKIKASFLNSVQSNKKINANGVTESISDLNAQKRDIQNSSLPDETKKQQLKDVQRKINTKTEWALKQLDNIKIDGDIAKLNNNLVWCKDDGKWEKIDDKTLGKINDSNISLNKYVKYKQNVTTYKKATGDTNLNTKEAIPLLQKISMSDNDRAGIYKEFVNPQDSFYQAVSVDKNFDINAYLDYKLQDFESDKDINGKTITNSRKKKVYNYIAQSSFDYPQRLMLTARDYKLQQSEKQYLAKYITNLDISTDEMITMFDSMGNNFTVYNGQVYFK